MLGIPAPVSITSSLKTFFYEKNISLESFKSHNSFKGFSTAESLILISPLDVNFKEFYNRFNKIYLILLLSYQQIKGETY